MAVRKVFAELDREALSSAALQKAHDAGCAQAEVRIESVRNQFLSLRDAHLESAFDDEASGVALRVVKDGAYGFSSTVEMSIDAVARLVDQAVEAARVSSFARRRPLERAPEPSHGRVEWKAPYRIDPTEISEKEKTERLASWSATLLSSPHVDRVTAFLFSASEQKHYADSNGTIAEQQRVRIYPAIEVLGIHDEGGFETMRTLAPPAGRGYEYLSGVGWDFETELLALPELLAEKLAAPSVDEGTYDLVIDPTNLWLTMHESIGHATELDRALGFEAAYAGTSFATMDKLGSFAYGSPIMNVTGDRIEPYGLATIGYDDEGVQTTRFDLVRDGVFVGYQLDREFAAEGGFARSNGCAYADSPLLAPMQRMANVSLASSGKAGPSTNELINAVERGIYIVGDKSWSIDMQRYNFQFTGQRFYRIDHGRLAGQVKDVAYQASTPSFWGSLVALGGEATYVLCGAMNCGKGQPAQTAPVSHGAPSALFSSIRVLNTASEATR